MDEANEPAEPTVRSRWVLHVDLDQFLAAVEVLRHPELRGRPVVVGGDGDPTRPRQVVATASYEARAFGVHSGIPMTRALRLCPDAVFLPADNPEYERHSARVMATLRSFPVRVEVIGWDEAFVGTDVDDPETLARDIRSRVLDETGLTCAVGIGDNKLRAKTATGFAKPGGIGRLTRDDWSAVMGARRTTALWGVGTRTAERLEALGIRTVDELAAADTDSLATAFGPSTGPWLQALGRGMGSRVVVTEPWVPRSRSHETTYRENLVEPSQVAAEVERLARAVTAEVVEEGRTVQRVAVKVRWAPFFTQSKIMVVRPPTQDPDEVAAAALTVLGRFDRTGPVRLLGVRVELVPPTG